MRQAVLSLPGDVLVGDTALHVYLGVNRSGQIRLVVGVGSHAQDHTLELCTATIHVADVATCTGTSQGRCAAQAEARPRLGCFTAEAHFYKSWLVGNLQTPAVAHCSETKFQDFAVALWRKAVAGGLAFGFQQRSCCALEKSACTCSSQLDEVFIG